MDMRKFYWDTCAVADGVCLCTKYDVRCTIAELARVAREFGEANADGMS